jgi:peptide/nickel transport system permease protein
LTLLLVSVVVFLLARITGNPADTLLPNATTPAERQAYIERLGLDRPLAEQYLIYMQGISRGDFGNSIASFRPVVDLAGPRILNSISLATVALILVLAISVPLGVLAAVYRDRPVGQAALLVAVLGQSAPTFWTGIMAILVFSSALHWLPAGGSRGPASYVLPASTMALFAAAGVVRLLRSSLLEILDSEFVKFERAKGVSEQRILWRHAVPNALIPSITFLGFIFGLLITVSISTEVIFAWPGIGRLAYEALLNRDFPLLQFCVLFFATVIVIINFAVDLLYVVIDPRIRL